MHWTRPQSQSPLNEEQQEQHVQTRHAQNHYAVPEQTPCRSQAPAPSRAGLPSMEGPGISRQLGKLQEEEPRQQPAGRS